MTFVELLNIFPTEKAVVDYYVNVRYGERACCNHCGSVKVYQTTKRPKVFMCNDCRNTFSPFTGTIFEHTSTDLRKWMFAIHLFLNGYQGISGYQLMREIGVTYKTAWRMLKQIRTAMGNAEQQEFVDTIIEMDETYVGGKPRKDNDHDDNMHTGGKAGRGTKKTPVVGVVDRENKKINSYLASCEKSARRILAPL